LAAAVELVHVTEHGGRDPVLVVRTPGFTVGAFEPLVRALVAEGLDVWEVGFPAREQTSADFVAALGEARAQLPARVDVVAHGVGATLALMAASELHPRGMYLLAPLLVVPEGPPAALLRQLPVGPAVDLASPLPYAGDTLQRRLGVDRGALEPVSGRFAAEVLAWHAPVNLAAVSVPVWVGFSIGDDVATLEDSLTASRALPHRTVVRFGLNRFDPKDFEHGELLTHPVPLRRLARAVR
jgi:hypothetical protein